MIMKNPGIEPPMEIIFDEPVRKKASLEWPLFAVATIGLIVGGIYGWNELSPDPKVPVPVPLGEVVTMEEPPVTPVLHSVVQDEPDPRPEPETNPEVRSWIMEAQKLEKTNPARAADLYTRVVEFQPGRSKIWHTVGLLRLRAGEEGAAKQAFERYLKDFPRDASVLGIVAVLEDRAGRAAEAERLYRRALQEAPSADLWHSLGNLHLRKRANARAVEAYKKALKLKPDHAMARFNLAVALEREDKIREAADALKGVEDPVARSHRDRLLVQTGGIPAEQVLKRMENSENPRELRTIASGLEAAGNWGKAKELLDRAVKLAPEDVSLRHNRGALAFRLGDLDLARREYRIALELDPQHAETHFNMGILHEGEEQFEKALASYEAALQCAPGHAGAMNNIGTLFLRVGKPGPAGAMFRKILAKDPSYANAHLNLAWAFLAQDQQEEALASLKKYISLVPAHRVEKEVLEKIRLLEENR